MSGIYRVFVRKEFSEESTWRDALGYAEPLLVHSSMELCLDAPDYLLTGSTIKDDVCVSLPKKTHRFDQSKNYM